VSNFVWQCGPPLVRRRSPRPQSSRWQKLAALPKEIPERMNPGELPIGHARFLMGRLSTGGRKVGDPLISFVRQRVGARLLYLFHHRGPFS
jgi:hypothetical protein